MLLSHAQGDGALHPNPSQEGLRPAGCRLRGRATLTPNLYRGRRGKVGRTPCARTALADKPPAAHLNDDMGNRLGEEGDPFSPLSFALTLPSPRGRGICHRRARLLRYSPSPKATENASYEAHGQQCHTDGTGGPQSRQAERRSWALKVARHIKAIQIKRDACIGKT